MATSFLVLDIATAPLPNAAEFLSDQDFAAPANYKDPEKIAAYLADKKAQAIAECALDPDLCRLSGMAFRDSDDVQVGIAHHLPKSYEADWISQIGDVLRNGARLISYNGLKFDWAVLNARARYLGVKFDISLDRYKTSHIDLYAKLTNHGQLKGHSLVWWVRRHGWTDLEKPLDGAEESKVFETGRWAELAASLRHDVEATRRLAIWMGILE